MYKDLNLQYLFSYFGTVPFFIAILDKFFFHKVEYIILINFLIYYSIIIFVFIGATNWNLKDNISKTLNFYGFLPSFFSVFLILLHLYSYNILLLLMSLILAQLFLDYFLVYKKKESKFIYFKVRAPLTIFILISLYLIKF